MGEAKRRPYPVRLVWNWRSQCNHKRHPVVISGHASVYHGCPPVIKLTHTNFSGFRQARFNVSAFG